MSRLAKNPIPIPSGVTVSIENGVVTVKGPKGELTRPYKDTIIAINIEGETIVLTQLRPDTLLGKSLWGTYASHITNMFHGVREGYQKQLEIQGIGYRAALVGKKIEMQLGFSHPVIIDIPEDLEVTSEKNILTISGFDKERVGWFSALLRSQKKPEPYKGKGIRYVGEVVRRKQGKKNV